MSGTLATFPYPIQNGAVPPEGRRAASFVIQWTNFLTFTAGVVTASVPINLLSQYQSGQFSTIQAVWVDNSGSPYAVKLSSAESAQIINIPPFTQGMYPLMVQQAPVFTAALQIISFNGITLTSCSTTLEFINVEMPFYQQSISPFGTNFGSLRTTIASSGASTFQVFIAPPFANQRYALSSLSLSFGLAGGATPFGANSVAQTFLQEANGIPRWGSNNNVTPSTFGIYCDKHETFPTPLILAQGSAVFIDTGGIVSSFAGTLTMTYGLITIS